MERFRYDRGSKWMIDHHGDAILRIGGITDIEAWHARVPEIVQPRQMPDGLLDVRRTGDDRFYPYIVEIETYPKNETSRKLLDDAMFVCQARGVLPDMIVLVLRPRGDVANRRFGRIEESWRIDDFPRELACRPALGGPSGQVVGHG